MQPKVSLVTACYNKQDYISSMLESVFNQTWDNMEVIIINDGSTDDSLTVIEQWIPKLRKRGFETTLINQENAGVSMALYNGLVRITGDYFCLPDADDLLKPEFVSKLVGVLENNPACDVALCQHYGGISGLDPENDFGMKYKVANTSDEPRKLSLEKFLLGLLNLSAWNCVFKSDLLNTCDCLMFLREGARVSQEPQIWLPLLNMNVNVYCFNETLYQYRTEANALGINGQKNYGDKIKMLKQGGLLRDSIVRRLRPLEAERFSKIINIRYLHAYYNAALNYSMTDDASEYKSIFMANINEFFDCGKCENVYAIFRAFSNYITQCGNEYVSMLISAPPEFNRIIGYGALGNIGKKLLPQMRETPLNPTVLWDAAAKCAGNLHGFPITVPEFDTLSSSDAVLVFIKDIKLASPLYEKLRNTGATVLYYYDILDYMAKYYFPDLYLP